MALTAKEHNDLFITRWNDNMTLEKLKGIFLLATNEGGKLKYYFPDKLPGKDLIRALREVADALERKENGN